MHSNYHVELNNAQAEAENNAEKLKETDILIFGPKEFDEYFLSYLKKAENTPIGKSSFQETLKSDSGGPKILAEQYASDCTLLVAFNEEGEAMVLHWPISSEIDFSGTTSEYLNSLIDSMKDLVKNTNGKFLITGMNSPEPDRDRTLKMLDLDSAGDVIPIFSSAKLTERDDLLGNMLENNIQGVCFIPKQLSNDGRNKIILLSKIIDQGKIEDSLRPSDYIKRII